MRARAPRRRPDAAAPRPDPSPAPPAAAGAASSPERPSTSATTTASAANGAWTRKIDAPAEQLGQHAAERRAERSSEHAGPGPERAAALRRGGKPARERQRPEQQERRPQPLDGAKGVQRPQLGGDRAGERRCEEDGASDQGHPARIEAGAEPDEDERGDGQDEVVGGDDPGDLRDRAVELREQVRQGEDDDRRVGEGDPDGREKRREAETADEPGAEGRSCCCARAHPLQCSSRALRGAGVRPRAPRRETRRRARGASGGSSSSSELITSTAVRADLDDRGGDVLGRAARRRGSAAPPSPAATSRASDRSTAAPVPAGRALGLRVEQDRVGARGEEAARRARPPRRRAAAARPVGADADRLDDPRAGAREPVPDGVDRRLALVEVELDDVGRRRLDDRENGRRVAADDRDAGDERRQRRASAPRRVARSSVHGTGSGYSTTKPSASAPPRRRGRRPPRS